MVYADSHVLYLGSTSYPRKILLQEAKIPFVIVNQTADEQVCQSYISLPAVVAAVARQKMDHVILPLGLTVGQHIFVLTADTLSQSYDGRIQGKPVDRADAVEKIRAARKGNNLCTAFCLDKKIWNGSSWDIQERIERVVPATLVFDIPDNKIDWYLDNSLAMNCSGAIQIEGLGLSFLKEIQGSYTAIVGLPLFELRESLEALQFSF